MESQSAMRFCALICAALVLGPPLAADDVYLRNGRSFEGVVTEKNETEVLIRLPFGHLTVPSSSVLRIEKSDTNQSVFYERFEELTLSEEAQAADWLELARWAMERELEHSARQAAGRAALLDPDLKGLAPVMRRLGYVLDEEIGRWIPYEDFMRRRGFVLVSDSWISREELAAQASARREERAARRAETRDERIAQAVELVALSQVERLQDQRSYRDKVGFPVAVIPVGGAVFPTFVHSIGFVGHPVVGFNSSPAVLDQLVRRQPGSLIPIVFESPDSAAPSVPVQLVHRQPGSLLPVRHNRGRLVQAGQ